MTAIESSIERLWQNFFLRILNSKTLFVWKSAKTHNWRTLQTIYSESRKLLQHSARRFFASWVDCLVWLYLFNFQKEGCWKKCVLLLLLTLTVYNYIIILLFYYYAYCFNYIYLFYPSDVRCHKFQSGCYCLINSIFLITLVWLFYGISGTMTSNNNMKWAHTPAYIVSCTLFIETRTIFYIDVINTQDLPLYAQPLTKSAHISVCFLYCLHGYNVKSFLLIGDE